MNPQILDNYKLMNILITGANNYIAKDLISLFAKNKANRIIATYKKKIVKIKKGNVVYKKLDLKKKININFKFDTLIHCAAATPLKFYTKKDYKIINIDGLKKILELCNDEVKHIILLSTVSVYGNITSRIISEKTSLRGSSEYAKSKINMEKKLKSFSKKNNTKILVLRLPGVIGKTLNNNNFLSAIISRIKKNIEFTIHNSDSLYNNLITTEVLYMIIKKFITKKNKKKFELYNCASTKPQKLISIIYDIEKIVKRIPKFKLLKIKKKTFIISTKELLKNKYPLMSLKLSLKRILTKN